MSNPGTGAELRERLFDCYASNLSAYLPRLQDVFLCPLCFRLFGRDSLVNNDVTKEHIIPQSLGGRLITLTCRECNNRDGELLDAALVDRFRAEDALSGLSHEPLRSRVRIGDGEMGADLCLIAGNPPRIEVYGIPRVSKPDLHAGVVRALEEGQTEFHVSLKLRYSSLRSRVAILRVGYLLMFRHFGYGYVLHKSLEQVRNQIRNPHQELIISKALVKSEEPPPEPNSVTLLYLPEELRCFLVTLDLSTEVDRYLSVIMPGLDSQSEQLYERWSSSGEGMQALQYSLVVLPFDRANVCDPSNAGLPARVWENIRRL